MRACSYHVVFEDEDVFGARQLTAHMVHRLKKMLSPNIWSQMVVSHIILPNHIPTTSKTCPKSKKHMSSKKEFHEHLLRVYRAQHGAFDATHAQRWFDSNYEALGKLPHSGREDAQKRWCWQLFEDSLWSQDQQWQDFLRPLLGARHYECAHLLNHAVQGKRYDVLEKIAPLTTTAEISNVLRTALNHGDAQAAAILLPFARPLSQNSAFLQYVAHAHSENHDLLTTVLRHSDTNKAARHCIYRKEARAADLILSHPDTPISTVGQVLEYARSNAQHLPQAQARWESHLLQSCVHKPVAPLPKIRKI